MINLSNMKIGKRMALGFGALIALLLVLAAITLWEMASIKKNMDIALEEAEKTKKIQSVSASINDICLEMWSIAAATNDADKRSHKATVTEYRNDYKKLIEELKTAAKTEQGKVLLGKLEEAIASQKGVNLRITELADKAKGRSEAAIELQTTEGMKGIRTKLKPTVDELIAWRAKRLQGAETVAQKSYSQALWILGIGAVAALGLAVFLGLIITRSIVLPITDCVNFTNLLAQSDFSRDVREEFRIRSDELGELARAYQTLVDNTRALLKNMTESVHTVASSATELSAVSMQTAQNVQTMSGKATTVAAAAEESSTNTVSVAAAMEQASTNLSSVASATEEMSATIGEIAANSEKARSISASAGTQAVSVSSLMNQLGQAAQEIGKVTETITGISSQTNLLALNATIEAARAGAAGKGFAVVANEIKELAKQTATATEDIKAKISGVQSSASSAIADIDKITGVIAEVGHIVSSIATAIEEQAVVTRDVAGNIAQASSGVQEANERVAQTASVSKSIAHDIAGVEAVATEIRSGGEQVQASAAELSKLAEELKSQVEKFKV